MSDATVLVLSIAALIAVYIAARLISIAYFKSKHEYLKKVIKDADSTTHTSE